MKELEVTSNCFENNGWIDNKYSGYGENVSPELLLKNIDENAKSIAITLDDMDHPLFPNYNHWVAWNIPVSEVIPENIVAKDSVNIKQGIAYGKHCYRGPKPPFNWNHRYTFTVYVVDTELSISEDSTKEDMLSAIEGHILQCGEIICKYQRWHK